MGRGGRAPLLEPLLEPLDGRERERHGDGGENGRDKGD